MFPSDPPATLSGFRIAVTRARSAAPGNDPLATLLAARGATPLHFPLTRILPPRDPAPLRAAGREILRYDWVILTSSRAVPPLMESIHSAGRTALDLRNAGLRVCAVGPGTAAALGGAGVRVDLVPDRFLAEGVVDALRSTGPLEGLRILLPRAEAGREIIPEALTRLGAQVHLVPAYRSEDRPADADALARAVGGREVDALTFTAGSGARSFGSGWREYCKLTGRSTSETGALPPELGVFALGPATAEALGREGIPVHGVAEPHTFEGLVVTLESWARKRKEGDAKGEETLDR